MSLLDALNATSLVVIAVSMALLASGVMALQRMLTSMDSTLTTGFQAVVAALARLETLPHRHDQHHAMLTATADYACWTWKDNRWVLRPESGPLELAGSPPTTPGAWDGECRLVRRP